MENYENMSRDELVLKLKRYEQDLSSIKSENNLEKTLHELQVYQIELEMQNREMKEIQQELEMSRDIYTDLYDFAPVGYITHDDRGIIQKLNITCANMLNLDRTQITGIPFISQVDKRDIQKFYKHLTECIKTKRKVSTEIRLKKKDNNFFYVKLTTISAINSGANLYRTVITDITELKQEEKELIKTHEKLEKGIRERTYELLKINEQLGKERKGKKEIKTGLKLSKEALKLSETRYYNLYKEYQSFIEAIPDIFLVVSPELEILWSNNIPPSQSGRLKKCPDIFNCIESCVNCPVVTSLSTGKTETHRIITRDKNIFDLKASPIKDDDGNITKAIVIASNVTEKIIFQKEAVRTSHLASLGEFSAGIAHEINNPINSIINYAKIIVNKNTDNEESYIAKEIIDEGIRIANIIKNLLSFARGEKQHKCPLSINKILSGSLSLAITQITKDGIEIKVDLPEDLPYINGKSSQLQQVFLNILSNARYALNKKYPSPEDNKIIEISGEKVLIKNNPFVRIIMRDNGCGINSDIQDKLILPFFSTKPPGEGTGLGLSISYGIIKDHDGEIFIESIEGEFTEIIINLPVWKE